MTRDVPCHGYMVCRALSRKAGRGVKGREVDGRNGVVEGREEERMQKGDDDDVGPTGDPAIESA